ncbi:MAG: hypothetical protein ACP6IY_02605 [Promethearchaeia archaeon]
MKLTQNQKFLIWIVFFLILIRLPITFFPDFLLSETIIAEEFIKGNLIYCHFEKFKNSEFYKEHVYPPGGYYYFLVKYFTFKNFILIIFDLINLFLIFKIISKFIDKESYIYGMSFLAFFPISILNSGFGTDPMQVVMIFIFLGIFFFFSDKIILSAISIAIGTLIIYIPSIILIPILIYYLKRKEIIIITKYIISFLSTLLIGILPFLILCPNEFINGIYRSLNQPHSASFLSRENFYLTQILLIHLFTIGEININVLNIFQLSFLIISIIIIYRKFTFTNKSDILPSTIILFITITIITLYIHLRFFYWIFILSSLIFSIDSKINLIDNFKVSKIIILGIVYFLISLFGLILAFYLQLQFSNQAYWIVGILIFFLHTFCFLIFSRLIKNPNIRIIILFSTLLNLLFILFIIVYELIIFPILIFNLISVLILFIEIFLLLFLIHFLNKIYQKWKKLFVIKFYLK